MTQGESKIWLVKAAMIIAMSMGIGMLAWRQALAESYGGHEAEVGQERPTKKFKMSSAQGAWLVRFSIQGGFAGNNGSVTITSSGQAAAGRSYDYACQIQLTEEELGHLQGLVASSKNANWMRPRRAADLKVRGSDRSQLMVELHRRESDGAERIYKISWYGDEEARISPSLVKLKEGLETLRKSIINDCQSYR